MREKERTDLDGNVSCTPSRPSSRNDQVYLVFLSPALNDLGYELDIISDDRISDIDEETGVVVLKGGEDPGAGSVKGGVVCSRV